MHKVGAIPPEREKGDYATMGNVRHPPIIEMMNRALNELADESGMPIIRGSNDSSRTTCNLLGPGTDTCCRKVKVASD